MRLLSIAGSGGQLAAWFRKQTLCLLQWFWSGLWSHQLYANGLLVVACMACGFKAKTVLFFFSSEVFPHEKYLTWKKFVVTDTQHIKFPSKDESPKWQLLLGITPWMPLCPWLAVKLPQADTAFNYNCRWFEWHYKTANPPCWQRQLQKHILAFPALLISWSHYWISSTAIVKGHCFIFYVSRTRLLFSPFPHINWSFQPSPFMYFGTVLGSLLISQKISLPTSASVQKQSALFVSTSKEHLWEWDYSHAFGLYFLFFGVECEASLLSIREAPLLTAKLLPNYSNYCCWWNGGAMRGLVIWPVILNESPQKERQLCYAMLCL